MSDRALNCSKAQLSVSPFNQRRTSISDLVLGTRRKGRFQTDFDNTFSKAKQTHNEQKGTTKTKYEP